MFALERCSREVSDLGKVAFNRARCILFDVRLNELEVAKNKRVVRGRERGQCKEKTTVRKDLQARSSMRIGQSNGCIIWRGEFGMCSGFTGRWRDRKGEDFASGDIFGDKVDKFTTFRELNAYSFSYVCQKMEHCNKPPKNSGSGPNLG